MCSNIVIVVSHTIGHAAFIIGVVTGNIWIRIWGLIQVWQKLRSKIFFFFTLCFYSYVQAWDLFSGWFLRWVLILQCTAGTCLALAEVKWSQRKTQHKIFCCRCFWEGTRTLSSTALMFKKWNQCEIFCHRLLEEFEDFGPWEALLKCWNILCYGYFWKSLIALSSRAFYCEAEISMKCYRYIFKKLENCAFLFDS